MVSILGKKLKFPVWLDKGPWPFELGVAILLMYTIECVRRIKIVGDSYSPNFRIAGTFQRYENEVILFCILAAMALAVGLALSVTRQRAQEARPFRVVGLFMAFAMFSFISYGFHVAWSYSFGGGAYLLLAWRTLCAGFGVLRETNENGVQ